MKRRLVLLYCITAFGFLLGIYRGKIALWAEDDPTPICVFPYSVHMLPQQDRALLEQGIHVADEKTLTRYLEDLMS